MRFINTIVEGLIFQVGLTLKDFEIKGNKFLAGSFLNLLLLEKFIYACVIYAIGLKSRNLKCKV